MEKTQAGDYRSEFSKFYFYIQVLEKEGEEKYGKVFKLNEGEYVFSKVPPLRSFQERYSISELKEIMSVTPKENLKKANSLIMKINSELEDQSKDLNDFKFLMNDLCISLDGRPLKI